MQPFATVEFFSKQLARSESGLIAAKASGNYQLLAFNIRQMFKARLMQGLVTWRVGENPRTILESAVDTALENAAMLTKLNPNARINIDLLFERVKIIGFLIGKPIELLINSSDFEAPDKKLDCLLASALNAEYYENEIEAEIVKLSQIKGGDLAARSYQTYFDILDLSSKNRSVAGLVNQAEKLFAGRSSDGFYAGGEQTEGGGLDNSLVVDYRLAAVLKKAESMEVGVHSSRW